MTSRENRCSECGTIRITFDPPLELEDTDEILHDAVWAVFRELRDIGGEFFRYMDSLFYTETSARAELQRQIDEYAAAEGNPEGHWIDADTWAFESHCEVLAVGKVYVQL